MSFLTSSKVKVFDAGAFGAYGRYKNQILDKMHETDISIRRQAPNKTQERLVEQRFAVANLLASHAGLELALCSLQARAL